MAILRDFRRLDDIQLWPVKGMEISAYFPNPQTHICHDCGADQAERWWITLERFGAVDGLVCLPCRDRRTKRHRNDRLRRSRAARRDQIGCGDGWRRCKACNTEYEATRSDAVYCSPACRQKSYRARVTDKQKGRAVNSKNRNSLKQDIGGGA